mmetsp:Transcript_7805/g.17616  ORF Transcript_7805/g.17616 Transcript_7805/m.17616 type:complete len:748 (-) Transcript_7805:33-2276(-)
MASAYEYKTDSCLDPVSHNSNEAAINGNSRHMASGLTIPERALQLFQDAEILAPMVRASTTPLRSLAISYGCDLVYSEEIIDRAITSTERVYNENIGTIDYRRKIESFSAKVQRRMATNNDPVHTVIRIDPLLERNKLIFQLGTGEAGLALPAAIMVQNDVDGIDINMGCPKKFSVSGGMGSALLEDLPRACDVVSTLCRNVSVPVSCKIRLLKDDTKTVDFVTALVKAGASAVAIHAREVGDEAQQAAQLDRLVGVVKLLKSSSIGVPIIINGDMYTRNDMVNLRRRSGADAVMLVRPTLYNTSIFRKPPINANDQANESQEEETRYGYDSKLLLSKTQVVQDYLAHAQSYEGFVKNIKYVVCEMMTNRRTPTNLSLFMPTKFSRGQTIEDICKCKSMESLCKIWDVSSRSAMVSNASQVVLDGGKESVWAVDMHTYDDRYFLDPEALRKEQEVKEAGSGKETEKESTRDNKSINSERPIKGERILEYAKNGNIDEALDLLHVVEAKYLETRNIAIKPNVSTYISVINALSKSKVNPQRAQDILDRIDALNDTTNDDTLRIDVGCVCYNTVLDAWGWSSAPDKVQRANKLFHRMLDLYTSESNLQAKPNIVTLNSLLNACAFARVKGEEGHAAAILEVATNAFEKFADGEYGSANGLTYFTMLKIFNKFLPMNDDRTEKMKNVFHQCCENGYLDKKVFNQLEKGVPTNELKYLLGNGFSMDAAGKVRIDKRKIPQLGIRIKQKQKK